MSTNQKVHDLCVCSIVDDVQETTKEEYEPDEATRAYVKRVLDGIPGSVDLPDLDNFKLWRAVASDEFPFGYKGRMVVMEQLVVSESIQKFIRGDIEDVNPDVIEKGQKPRVCLRSSRLWRVLAALRGETTLEEVGRVI